MKRKLLLSTLMSLMLIGSAWAQRTITGTVIDATQGSLPGATVQVNGTNTGTTTDLEGKYSIVVPEGSEILVFRFVGYISQEVTIGNRTNIDVTLEEASELTEVVVTAQNISREKASLAYSQQNLDGAAVSTVKETNFINSLSGKAAGVQVRQNNTMGGSTNIIIRGNSSFTSNQPLFVVDGIPIGNNTNNDTNQSSGRRGYDYGNPAADINPEDIASMSILKGASATALYGSRGQNGVILITTKKGTKGKGIGVNLSTGVTIGTIDKSTFAEYQDEYGAGYSNYYYGSTGAFEDIDVNGDGVDDLVVPTTEDGSYGGAFDPNLNVYYWDSFVPESPNFGKARPWQAANNGPVEFFETQVMYNNTVSLQGGNDNGTFRLSYNNLDQKGILPNSTLIKNTINFNGTLKLTEKLSSNVMFQYNKQDVVGRYSTGYSDNLMSQFRQWWQVNTDILALKDIYDKTGKNYTWNPADPTDAETPIYWDNPYWTRYKNYNSDTRDRMITKVGIDYKFNDWLNLSTFATIDGYTEVREERRAVGSIPTEFGVNSVGAASVDEPSGYQRTNIESVEYNYNGILSVNKMLSDDFSLAGLVGFNIRKERYQHSQQSTSGGIAVPELYSLSNSISSNPFPYEYLREKEVYGYFANANLGYKGYLYLDGNYRMDVSSALPTTNNQYDYYSIGLGFVFSELINIDQISYGKVRASYGTVGNDTRALRVNDTYVRSNNFQGGVLTTLPSTKNNSGLKPEITAETELGLEMSMFKRRLNIDFAVYNRETSNQLLSVQLSRATGYNSTFINAGTIQNRGIELTLGGVAVKKAGFTYSPSINFTLNRNKVLSLIGDTENYVVGDFQGGVTSNATIGQPLGILRGTGYEYLDGEKVVNSSGYYVSAGDQIIGNPNPDWNMGINNMFTYKGVNLSFLIDIQKGGDVFSLDMHYGKGTGLYPETVGNNDKGNPIRDEVDAGGGILLPGVTSDGQPNTTYARADYYGGAFYWGNQSRNPNQINIFDGSSVRLRELAISYTLPQTIASKIKAEKVNFSLVGRNLWIISKNVPYADPESGLGVGTAQGYLSGSYPTVRTYGFKLDVSF